MALPIIGDIIAAGASAIDGILGKAIGNKAERDAAKAAAHLEMVKMAAEVETTYRAELELQKTVMVAEIQSDDKYTSRARPSITYAGLAVMVYNGVLRVLFSDIAAFFDKPMDLTPVNLPTELWAAWGGVVGLYAVGRTREKIGSAPGNLLNSVFGKGSK